MRRVYHHFEGRPVTIGIAGGWVRRLGRDDLVMKHIPGAKE
ncbi:hypothetical protein Godav_029243 [Gossypium davidsonii]|uniref:Uncharacterized protein n=1 Tax=Gossypium davidsonii TaxID=34287 RepID=A0A7J8TBK7_GOSDV|nr:hypothetical protein [Gossypium davidsonii]